MLPDDDAYLGLARRMQMNSYSFPEAVGWKVISNDATLISIYYSITTYHIYMKVMIKIITFFKNAGKLCDVYVL